MKDYEYDVALSFAGEDRKYAHELAKYLTANSIRVFYDEFEQSKLWGKNLYDYLTQIYSKKSEYCVMFLSKHYAAKAWTTLERQSAQERAFNESKEYILPLKIDDTEIPGVSSTIGYIDLRKSSLKNVGDMILVKLGKSATLKDEKIENENEFFIPELKKEFSQRDIDKFMKDTFVVIKEYFQNALSVVEKKYQEVQTDYDEITKYKFIAKVYYNGTLKNQCKIWIGGLISQNSINYVSGSFDIQSDNSLNVSIAVVADSNKLFLKPLGPDLFSNIRVQEKATPKQAAEYFWSKFIQYLQ